jgi:hypothetical protein
MSLTQRDALTEIKPYFLDAITKRLGKQEQFGTADAAGVFDVSETTIREWIEEGRLVAADLNAGRHAPVDPDRPGLGERPMRPYYRIQREAILALAKRMEIGI